MKHLFSIKKLFFDRHGHIRFPAIVVAIFSFIFIPFLLPLVYSLHDTYGESSFAYFSLQGALVFSLLTFFGSYAAYDDHEEGLAIFGIFISGFSFLAFFFLVHYHFF